MRKLIKIYGRAKTEGPDWYTPTKVLDAITSPSQRQTPRLSVSTSSCRASQSDRAMHLRRFTRLTNAFSKKLDNLKAAVSLYMAFYNFVRVHQALRVTPAMQAGLTDHIWTMQELLEAA